MKFQEHRTRPISHNQPYDLTSLVEILFIICFILILRSFHLPSDLLCDLIWWLWTPFEAITGRTASSVFSQLRFCGGFLDCKVSAQPPVSFYCHPYHQLTDVPLEASGLWIETRTGAGGTATLVRSFFDRNSWSMNSRVQFLLIINEMKIK